MGAPKSPYSLRFNAEDGPIRVAVSACLLGQLVRWDGTHRRDAWVADVLGAVFEWVPVCPEVEVGLGVPRPPIRLVAGADGPRAVGVDHPELDATGRLAKHGRAVARALDDVCGYILKSDSPSCGMAGVQVYRETGGRLSRQGVGVYAQALMAARPGLPIEEEGRLGDAALRENFVERVFAYRRWLALRREGFSRAKLFAFHRAHTLTLMAHGGQPLEALGRLVATASQRPLEELAAVYLREFMAALKRPATRTSHTRVLTRLAGYLKRDLGAEDRERLAQTIAGYRQGSVPLTIPINLLRQHCLQHPHPDAVGQVYLEPHPAEAVLRSLV